MRPALGADAAGYHLLCERFEEQRRGHLANARAGVPCGREWPVWTGSRRCGRVPLLEPGRRGRTLMD